MANSLGSRGQLVKMASGPYGGTLECASIAANGAPWTMCASINSAAYVIVLTADPDQGSASETTRQVISAVEH